MFGDYEIIESVGEGGMGVVYRAKDTSLGRIVALKVLKDDLRSHKSLVARFQREAEAYATLNHPHIVHIYSVGAVGKIPYIAMEFIEGGTLSVTMKRERRIPWERALLIAEQIAEGLGSAHSMGIIHRDIKPGNIMLSPDEHAYVTDFGIAKVLTAETQLTIEGSRLGTPQYMSPERCRKESGTASSDLYSLGVMLFQMISGRLPYESNDTGELIRKIVVDPPRRLSDFMPDIPEDVERLVAFLIEKKTKDRPQSAEEWVALSQRVRAGEVLGGSDKAFQSSLEELREKTSGSSFSDTHFTFEEESFWWRAQSFWLTLSLNIRTALVALLVMMVGGFWGWREAVFRAPEQAGALAQSIGATKAEWKNIGPVASFYDEMPGVLEIQLSDKEWLPVPLVTVSGDVCLVKIEVLEDGKPSGRKGLVEVNQLRREVRILVPPMPLSNMDVISSNAESGVVNFRLTSTDKKNVQLYTYSAQDKTVELKRTSYAALWGRMPHGDFSRIGNFERNTITRKIVSTGILEGADGQWGMYNLFLGKRVGTSIIKPGGMLGALALIGNSVVYSQLGESGHYQLFQVTITGLEQDTIALLDHLKAPESFSVHPDRPTILATVVKSGRDEVVVLDGVSGDVKTVSAGASAGMWHPNGEDALVLAPDTAGVLQVWQVLVRESRVLKQLTTFEDGVHTLGPLTHEQDRLFVRGGTKSQPTLLLIDLP